MSEGDRTMQEGERTALLDLTEEELSALLAKLGHKRYRARQILSWVYQKFAGSFEEMTDLPTSLRQALEKALDFSSLELVGKEEGGGDWAKKFLWGKDKRPLVESVLLSTDTGSRMRIYAGGMSGRLHTALSPRVREGAVEGKLSRIPRHVQEEGERSDTWCSWVRVKL